MADSRRFSYWSLGAFLVIALAGCGEGTRLEIADLAAGGGGDESRQDDGSDPVPVDPGDGGGGGGVVKPYCSELSFEGVKWNASLSPYERRSLAIALSLSGSFEGPNGWRNLTNNFDGMGMSAGLLNQTLGTGSLQPLMANLKARAPTAYNLIASSRRTSLLAMIDKWVSAKSYRVPSLATASRSLAAAAADEDVTSSPLDIPDGFQAFAEFRALGAAEDASVAWAKSNLYQANGSFKPEWSAELKNLLAHPAYVSEQILAAEVLHRRALGYAQRLGFTSLRAYLFMFDICVQNGGLNEAEFTELQGAIQREGLRDEAVILKRLLEIRLRRVLAQWRSDVRARKTAVIDGTGVVHGARRDFPKQYCYSAGDPVTGG